jgi:hypothetical protein
MVNEKIKDILLIFAILMITGGVLNGQQVR